MLINYCTVAQMSRTTIRSSLSEIVVSNVRRQMELHDNMDNRKLAEASGVSPRHVAYVLSGERAPSLEILDRLASAFKIPGWRLTIPDDAFGELADNYLAMGDDSKRYLERVAEKEATYPL